MGLISLLTPTVGLPNATEDPKIASDIVAIGTLVNGSLDLVNLSSALQAQIPPATWTPYTPTWTSATGGPAVGNGTLSGSYLRFGKTCAFLIYLLAGSTTNGSTGAMSFGLPVAAAGGISQDVGCRLSGVEYADPAKTVPFNAMWRGVAIIDSGASVCQPYFPLDNPQSRMGPFTNSITGVVGEGTPHCVGTYPLDFATFTISGMYQTT